MSIYTCSDDSCPIEHIEFSPRGSGNLAFIKIRNSKDAGTVEEALNSPNLEQHIITSTKLDGHTVLVTSGPRSADEVISTLKQQFPLKKEPKQKASIDPWQIRAVLGFTGQGLVLASTFLNNKFDSNVATFAASNILANTIAITFGGNDEEDLHRLKHVKHGMNSYFHDLGVDDLPPVEGHDATDVLKEPVPLNSLEKTKKFISNYSAQLSIGLRYFGALKLAGNGFNSSEVMSLLGEGKFGQAARKVEIKDPLLLAAGAGTLTGKTLAMTSNTVNPYDPKPASTLDKIREKFFVTGGLVEAGAFSALAYQGFAKRKIQINGNEYRDFLRGSGSLLFVAAYLARTFASFEKHVTDMDEVYAHVADGLAHAPKEKLDQIVANTAAMVTAHFKDEHLHFGEVYNRLADDLYKFHGVALTSFDDSMQVASAETKSPTTTADQPQHSTHDQHQDVAHTESPKHKDQKENKKHKESIAAVQPEPTNNKKSDSFANELNHAPSSNIYLDKVYKSTHAQTHIS